MLVILDTNVLIGALISPNGPHHIIYDAWCSGRFELVTSLVQLEEIRQVSRYSKLKSILPPHRVGTMINNMQNAKILETLPALPPEIKSSDPNDDFLLAMALESNADYLITGDRKSGLLQIGKLKRTKILAPADFCLNVLSIKT